MRLLPRLMKGFLFLLSFSFLFPEDYCDYILDVYENPVCETVEFYYEDDINTYTFEVPYGVESIYIQLWGAEGTVPDQNPYGGVAGLGGYTEGQVPNYQGSGGGMYLIYSNPILNHVTISGNTAYIFSGDGGGMYLYFSNPVLNYVSISGNIADYRGGGINSYFSNPIDLNGMPNASYATFRIRIKGGTSDPAPVMRRIPWFVLKTSPQVRQVTKPVKHGKTHAPKNHWGNRTYLSETLEMLTFVKYFI